MFALTDLTMSDKKGRKRSGYKRWLYDSSETKPKVTKWREQRKNSSGNNVSSSQNNSELVDSNVELEEIGESIPSTYVEKECNQGSPSHAKDSVLDSPEFEDSCCHSDESRFIPSPSATSLEGDHAGMIGGRLFGPNLKNLFIKKNNNK